MIFPEDKNLARALEFTIEMDKMKSIFRRSSIFDGTRRENDAEHSFHIALMALAFMEQWVLWIITNVISVAMWCICLARGEAHAAVMVIMWVFYLLNSLNGFRVWLALSRE